MLQVVSSKLEITIIQHRMENANQKNENKFFRLFDDKQKAYKELNQYVIKKGQRIDLIKDMEFKILLKKESIASNNFSNFLSE
jgi:hypothetical protein